MTSVSGLSAISSSPSAPRRLRAQGCFDLTAHIEEIAADIDPQLEDLEEIAVNWLRRFWDAIYPFLVFTGEGIIGIAEWVSHFKSLYYRCGFRRLLRGLVP